MFPEAVAALQSRLDSRSRNPIAVAVSGGGDSLAALILTVAWARTCGRPVVALSVDHQLQSHSGDWTRFVGETASRLGARFRPLAWSGSKPATGLAAQARAARHRLLAEAARDEGAQVIVTGHTRDDARENALLGQGAIALWSPSPVWPEGRGLFLLRPLLRRGRMEIRQALAEAGERWIDDPANDDPAHARVRARQSPAPATLMDPPPPLADLAAHVAYHEGVFRLDRQRLRAEDPDQVRRLIAAAVVCAGGAERLPKTGRVSALTDRLKLAGEVQATLAGARIVGSRDVEIGRNAGEARRGGLRAISLWPGKSGVWDGRYAIFADAPLHVAPAGGLASRLSRRDREQLRAVPACFRGAVPLIVSEDGVPRLAHQTPSAKIVDLPWQRFLGACGAIAQEIELAQGAHGATQMGVLCSSLVTK